jgi:hypothetical protein
MPSHPLIQFDHVDGTEFASQRNPNARDQATRHSYRQHPRCNKDGLYNTQPVQIDQGITWMSKAACHSNLSIKKKEKKATRQRL